MNKYRLGKKQLRLGGVLYGSLLLMACATTSGPKGDSCRVEQRPAMVNNNQEAISVTVCKRQEGRPWNMR